MRTRFIVFLAILLPGFIFSQTKIFYDIEGKGTDESNATYYRVIGGDTTKDYYLSGEIAGVGILIKNDDKDDSKTLWRGKRTTYYRVGAIKSEVVYNNDGKRDGECTTYYESGKKQQQMTCKNGMVVGKFYYEWDEFGKEQKVFIEHFDKGNIYDWPLNTNARHSCKILKDTGLYMATLGDNGVAQAINLPLDPMLDYNIETVIQFKGGKDNAWHGMIWGFKDWDNYCFFSITSAGHFSTGAMVDGLLHYTIYDKYSDYINEGKDVNELRIFKTKDKITFSINNMAVDVEVPFTVTDKYFKIKANAIAGGAGIVSGGGIGAAGGVAGGSATVRTRQVTEKYVVDRTLNYELKGNYTGFMLEEGEDRKQQCIFQSLSVHQKLDTNDTNTPGIHDTNSAGTGNEFKGWRGNGSGFFIDTAGYIATNYHVIKDAKEIQVDALQNGDRVFFAAKVISMDKASDLAVLKITDPKFQHYASLPYSISGNTSDVGSNVFTLGFPAANILGTEVKFTDGKISSKTGPQGKVEWYQISVPAYIGNSGGPLFDYDGNVIGIVNAKSALPGEENINYSIKSSYLKTFLESLPEKFAFPANTTLAAKPLTEKIKVLTDYVVMVKVR